MLTIRSASHGDAPTILTLLDQLGWSAAVRQRVTAEYIHRYLEFSHNCILLAEKEVRKTSGPHFAGRARFESKNLTVGLLAYSIRPDLYHGGDACLIENFVVDTELRGQGIGSALLKHLLDRLYETDCVTLLVDVEPDNLPAIQFYQRHGLDNQVLLLERHL
ncbi:GNAT family N-acetyltransferase [Chloroflexota bacterium]